MNLEQKTAFAVALCKSAGEKARALFESGSALNIEQKGAQDWVSNADREVELLIRAGLAEAFPEDGVVGEEHEDTAGSSGFDWVIDPIDGTTNFVNAIPNWTIVLAGVSKGKTQIGVIHDPLAKETFVASKGVGAGLNGAPISVAKDVDLASGTVAVGYSNRVDALNILPVVKGVVESGAMFHRNASGALSLAYVAAGRLLGYLEEHMNAWDCLAGQLLIEEAGGVVEDQNADDMIRNGGRVIVGAPQVFDDLKDIAEKAWR